MYSLQNDIYEYRDVLLLLNCEENIIIDMKIENRIKFYTPNTFVYQMIPKKNAWFKLLGTIASFTTCTIIKMLAPILR